VLLNDLIPFPIPYLHWDVVLFANLVFLLGADEWKVPEKAVYYLKKPNVKQLDVLTGATASTDPDETPVSF
jgi:uncharacterized membrane protein